MFRGLSVRRNAALLLCLAAPVLATASAPSWDLAFSQGVEAIDEGRYREALPQLNAALDLAREFQLGDLDTSKADQRIFSQRLKIPHADCELRHGAALPRGAPHFSRMVLSDSCSALFTTSQRRQAVGSIWLTISCSTQSRRSFGSIASSSQQRLP